MSEYEEGSRETAELIVQWIAKNEPVTKDKFLEWWNKATEPETIEGNVNDTLLTPAPSLTRDMATGMGYTGDSCIKCGSLKMVHTGHCNTCQECGETTGCS